MDSDLGFTVLLLMSDQKSNDKNKGGWIECDAVV